jgi:hypothetical protein
MPGPAAACQPQICCHVFTCAHSTFLTCTAACALRSPFSHAAGQCDNQVLVANDDSITVREGKSVTFNPLDNDVIPTGQTASVTSLGMPTKGTAVRSDNAVTYTPTVTGLTEGTTDQFTVTIQDTARDSATSTTYVTILPQGTPLGYTWVTPDSGDGCDVACAALGTASGWRYVNGGTPNGDWAMCAGLIDLPDGMGQQWLVGRTTYFQSICYIKCATSPCWDLPPGAVRDPTDFIFAGALNSYELNGEIKLKGFPVKCACAQCTGDGCDSLYWAPSGSSSACPQPTIEPQPGEEFPSTVYSRICRSNQDDGSYGYTGWLKYFGVPVRPIGNRQLKDLPSEFRCEGYVMSAADYSVWCPNVIV